MVALIQLLLGVLIFTAGYIYDSYFPPTPGAWDQNRLQNGMDASLMVIYLAVLLTTVAAEHLSEEMLNSVWIVFSPSLAVPAAFMGYYMRSIHISRQGVPPSDSKSAPLEGHSTDITCLAISEHEGAIFSGSHDNLIKKWDLNTGNLMETLQGHNSYITCLAISENEGAIFSGSDDSLIKKWDLETGNLMETLQGHNGSISCLAILEKEGAVLSGSGDGAMRVWDSKSCTNMWEEHAHITVVKSIACSQDGVCFSASDRICTFDCSSFLKYDVVVSTKLPVPGFSLEKVKLPWALLTAAIITRVCTLGQLASCSLQRKTAMPRRWIPPTEALNKFADLGLPIGDVLDFKRLYTSVIIFILSFDLLL